MTVKPTNEDWSILTLKEGDGKTYPTPGDKVTIHYVGRFVNKEVFDTSHDEDRGPFTFTIGVGDVIEPWDYGI